MKELTIYQSDNGEWTVISDKMPGFAAKGRTQEEAIEKMKKAFSVYFPCGGDNCRETG